MQKAKYILIILLIVFTANYAVAQKKWQVGTDLSLNASKYVYSNDYVLAYPLTNSNYGLGAGLGLGLYRNFGLHFKLKTGLAFNLKHYNEYKFYKDNYADIKRSLFLLSLPLMLQYHFQIREHRFFINSGIEVSWMYKSVNNVDDYKFTENYAWNPVYEIYFGLAYKFKIGEKHSFFINPEYSPKIFDSDYATFRLNFGIVF